MVMVERDAEVARNLAKNIAALKTTHARLVNADASGFLAGSAEPFDIVFVDPPFAESTLINQCIVLLQQQDWLSPGALVYVEAPSSFDELVLPENWSLLKSKKAGQVGYHLLQTAAEQASL